MQIEKMAAHLEQENRDGERQSDPEAARHIYKLGIRLSFCRDDLRFERHAANGAKTRADLPDLRMHRACIDRARRNGLRFRLLGLQIFFGIGDELRPATRRAEIIGLPLIIGVMLRSVRIDAHPADRVLDLVTSGRCVVMMHMIVRSGLAHPGLMRATGLCMTAMIVASFRLVRCHDVRSLLNAGIPARGMRFDRYTPIGYTSRYAEADESSLPQAPEPH